MFGTSKCNGTAKIVDAVCDRLKRIDDVEIKRFSFLRINSEKFQLNTIIFISSVTLHLHVSLLRKENYKTKLSYAGHIRNQMPEGHFTRQPVG